MWFIVLLYVVQMMAGNEKETVSVITSRQEQYQCLLPEQQQLEESSVVRQQPRNFKSLHDYSSQDTSIDGGDSAHSLLADVFKSERCSLLVSDRRDTDNITN